MYTALYNGRTEILDEIVVSVLRDNPDIRCGDLLASLREEGFTLFGRYEMILTHEQVYGSLLRLEKATRIEREVVTKRTILWHLKED